MQRLSISNGMLTTFHVYHEIRQFSSKKMLLIVDMELKIIGMLNINMLQRVIYAVDHLYTDHKQLLLRHHHYDPYLGNNY